jgi:hypothetical protein
MLSSIEYNLDITYFNLALVLSLASIRNQTKTLSMPNFHLVDNCKNKTQYNNNTMRLNLVKPNPTTVSIQKPKKEKLKNKK